MSFGVGTPTLQVAMAYTPLINDHKKSESKFYFTYMIFIFASIHNMLT